ncbi:MAG: SDR family NAD(P)-dependent oxidoreductase [Pseudomonadota bacterium]
MNETAFKIRFGRRALVTGATSGIGREFADQLAALGVNLLVVSRRQDALDDMAQTLTEKAGIEARTLALGAPEFLASLLAAVDDPDIGLFVSNAGADHGGALLRIPRAPLRAMQRPNAASRLDVVHGFGTRCLDRRKAMGLICVSSTASPQATPLVANYAGAKALCDDPRRSPQQRIARRPHEKGRPRPSENRTPHRK